MVFDVQQLLLSLQDLPTIQSIECPQIIMKKIHGCSQKIDSLRNVHKLKLSYLILHAAKQSNMSLRELFKVLDHASYILEPFITVWNLPDYTLKRGRVINGKKRFKSLQPVTNSISSSMRLVNVFFIHNSQKKNVYELLNVGKKVRHYFKFSIYSSILFQRAPFSLSKLFYDILESFMISLMLQQSVG